MNKLLILGAIILGFIISLFFEEARDFYSDILTYIISFEWLSDLGDLFGSMFENIGEFSVYGLGFGVLGTTLIFFTRDYMITPFVQYYPPVQATFWTIATYITVFIGGYLLGKAFENTA